MSCDLITVQSASGVIPAISRCLEWEEEGDYVVHFPAGRGMRLPQRRTKLIATLKGNEGVIDSVTPGK